MASLPNLAHLTPDAKHPLQAKHHQAIIVHIKKNMRMIEARLDEHMAKMNLSPVHIDAAVTRSQGLAGSNAESDLSTEDMMPEFDDEGYPVLKNLQYLATEMPFVILLEIATIAFFILNYVLESIQAMHEKRYEGSYLKKSVPLFYYGLRMEAKDMIAEMKRSKITLVAYTLAPLAINWLVAQNGAYLKMV